MARHVDIQCILLLALHNSTVHPGHVPNRPLKTLSSVLSSYWTIGCVKFDQSSVKYTLRNTENYNHQWLSDSSRVHQIRFRTGLRPERHWGSLLRSAKPPSWLGTAIPPPNPNYDSSSILASSVLFWLKPSATYPDPPTDSLSPPRLRGLE